jgi:hypothetical protein
MIERLPNGKYHCRGRECGYPLAWFDCDPEDGSEGMWVCLDCNAGMYAARPASAEAEAA